MAAGSRAARPETNGGPLDLDLTRAILGEPDAGFERFRVGEGVPLADAELDPALDLMVVERGGARQALLLPHMRYHHVAQGRLAGEPYLINL